MANKMVTLIPLAPYLSAARRGESTDSTIISGEVSALCPLLGPLVPCSDLPWTNKPSGRSAGTWQGRRKHREDQDNTHCPMWAAPSRPAWAPQRAFTVLDPWHCQVCRS